MKVKRFKIPIYEYSVTLIEAESSSDADEVRKLLIRETIAKEDTEGIVSDLQNGSHNGGYTYRNFRYRKFVIFLFPMKTQANRLNKLGHEKRHIEDRLAEHAGVNDIEALAYLAGFLTEKLFT